MELKTKMTESGVLYVPKGIREAFGRELAWIPNSCAVVMFRRGTEYRHVLSSLEIIVADIKHRITMANERNPRGGAVIPNRPKGPPTTSQEEGGK